MRNVSIAIAIVLALVAMSVLTFRFLSPEDTWNCVNGEWVRHGNPSQPQPTTGCGSAVTNAPIEAGNRNMNRSGAQTNTNETTTTPADQASCEAQGGIWGPIGLFPKASCNLPTSDAGKACTDGADCEAKKCLATVDERDPNLKLGMVWEKGACPDYQYVVGCLWTIRQGTLNRVCYD